MFSTKRGRLTSHAGHQKGADRWLTVHHTVEIPVRGTQIPLLDLLLLVPLCAFRMRHADGGPRAIA